MLRYFVPYERIGKLQLRNRFVKGKRIWKSVSKATKPTIWSKSQKSSKPVEAFASPWTNNKPICQKPNMLLQKYSSFNKEFYLDCCWRTSRNSLIILTVKKRRMRKQSHFLWWLSYLVVWFHSNSYNLVFIPIYYLGVLIQDSRLTTSSYLCEYTDERKGSLGTGWKIFQLTSVV